MPEKLILVGRIAGAFGVKGEVRVTTYTENPLSILSYGQLLRENGEAALTLHAGRAQGGGVICRAKEIATKEDADKLRGLKLFVDRAALPAPEEDEFYINDLVGLEAFTPEGESLGRVRAVQDFGAGELIEIEAGRGRPGFYLPFTRECVPDVDIPGGRLTVVRPVEVDEKD